MVLAEASAYFVGVSRRSIEINKWMKNGRISVPHSWHAWNSNYIGVQSCAICFQASLQVCGILQLVFEYLSLPKTLIDHNKVTTMMPRIPEVTSLNFSSKTARAIRRRKKKAD